MPTSTGCSARGSTIRGAARWRRPAGPPTNGATKDPGSYWRCCRWRLSRFAAVGSWCGPLCSPFPPRCRCVRVCGLCGPGAISRRHRRSGRAIPAAQSRSLPITGGAAPRSTAADATTNRPEAFTGGDTAGDHYNRGNALARAGDLRGALDAYREALARHPGHEDAEHNREIVESLLESQPEPRPTGEEQGEDGRDGNGSASPQDAGGGAQDRTGPRPEEDLQAGGRGESGEGVPDTRDGPETRSGTRSGERARSGQASEDSHATRENEVGEADARGGSAASADRTQDGSGPEVPLTEEQRLAYEQWLRRIPDDPGGLLRRKFALEYRARENRPPARSDAW